MSQERRDSITKAIIKAYEVTGLEPREDVYYVEDGCACAVGVVWAKVTGRRSVKNKHGGDGKPGRASPDNVFRNRFGVTSGFVSDLIKVFDSGYRAPGMDPDAVLVGLAVRKALEMST